MAAPTSATAPLRKLTAVASSRPSSVSSTAPKENFQSSGIIAASPRLYDVNMDLEKIYLSMERGHRVSKINVNRRGECSQRHCCIKRETRQLILSKTDITLKNTLAKPSCIDMRTVKEIKTLEHKLVAMNIVDKWRSLGSLYDPAKILIIYHGSNFVLNTLVVAYDTQESCQIWAEGLTALVKEAVQAPYPILVERWLRKEFYVMVNPQTNSISVKDLKPFIQQRLQYKITSKALQALTEGALCSLINYQQSVTGIGYQLDGEATGLKCKEQMGFEAFANAYRRLVHVNSLFADRFKDYSTDGKQVNFNAIVEFFASIQKDEIYSQPLKCGEFLRRFLKDVDVARDIAEPFLSVNEFIDYLFSKDNSIWDPINNEIVQDMDQPLCNYWVASSHNTYLTGDQLKSESSLEAYARALLMGCRCIELDCWDGQKKGLSDAEIVIYHGYTMTSKLNLRDVLHTIREYAFQTSDYPVILSIEDNCTVHFQRQLAQDLKEILGDYLLTTPIEKDETKLPSPSQMRRRIVVKHKKLPTETERTQSVASLTSIDDSFQDQDILSKPGQIKRGILQLKDPETGDWQQHIFVLFPDCLCYTQDTNQLLAAAGPGVDGTPSSNEPNADAAMQNPSGVDEEGQDQQEIANTTNPDELHLTEEWFHGKISRDDAVHLLKKHLELGDGLFLVRESTTFIGDYSLSFLHREDVHHCRIKTTQSAGSKHFYLLESKKMETLYELISYYQEHQLTTPKFRAKLITPCPQPSPHIGQPWFAGDIDRQKAEDMLNAHPLDGSYLIRNSSTTENIFTLSFRVDGMIIHGRLKQEGRMFVIGSHQFENLNLMVAYYNKHEFYHGVFLKYPVNAEAIELYAKDVSHAPSGCYLDLQNIDNKKLLVRARCSYVAADDRELSFPFGAIIDIVQKEDGFWWKGVYKNKQGMVPVDHVEILPGNYNFIAGAASDGLNMGLGLIELARSSLETVDSQEQPYAFKLFQSATHADVRECLMAASTKDDQSDWINSLTETMKAANDKVSQLRSREKVMRIASELSNLVIYCQAVPFNPERIPGNYYEMCSFSDSKLERLVEKGLLKFNLNQLSRVYPNASRLTSANFNPIPMWSSGCQMVALNYQTPDKPMQLNQGRFLANGRCGYVLKPYFMRQSNYDPDKINVYSSRTTVTLTIEVIAGRHLCRKDKGKGIVSPVVEVEILGLPCDTFVQRTKAVSCDGLHPVWGEYFEFVVHFPEAALVRFHVEDGDFVGPSADPFIGQAVFPVDCLRSGYRSVPLKNAFSEDLELSSLLVHLDKRKQDPSHEKLFETHLPVACARSSNALLGPRDSMLSSSHGSLNKSYSHASGIHGIHPPESNGLTDGDLSSSNNTISEISTTSPHTVPKKKISASTLKKMFRRASKQ